MDTKPPDYDLRSNRAIDAASEGQARERAGAAIGAVIIGRNEGERLRRCLLSVVGRAAHLVYVDSGSSDGSVELAKGMGAVVVDLDTSVPFTAARARNAGLAKLRELEPHLEIVQFVDGDCEVVPGWLDVASSELRRDSRVAVVCGRLRERHIEASIYNRLCDIEWNQPAGLTDSCGGNAMMRIDAFVAVNGFAPDLIAGEEPDLCLRLRQRGYLILRLADEMMLHDAAMTRFAHWCRRVVRSGHAYAEGHLRHWGEPGRYYAKQVRSNLAWGVLGPLLAVGLAHPSRGLSLALLAGYPLLALRVFRSARRRGMATADASLYAVACVIGKVPSAYGQIRFWFKHLLGRRSELIEYKRPSQP